MERIFGGNPIAVIIRLVIISVIVGIVMAALDIQPQELIERLGLLARRIYDMGFGAIEWGLQYFLLGAIVVIPIWVIMRLIGSARGSKDRNRP
ncbi:MAG: DUF6460 domain-containing protein [Pseudomonadota bacterium]